VSGWVPNRVQTRGITVYCWSYNGTQSYCGLKVMPPCSVVSQVSSSVSD